MSPIGPAETLVYIGLVLAVGLSAARRAEEHPDGYFLAQRSLSAWTACLSLVATELTVVAFLAVAGSSLRDNHTGFQIAVGYLIGRVLLAFTLLPGLFNGTQFTAYQRLHMRFGLSFRLVGAALFAAVRVLRDSAMLVAAVALLSLLTGWSPAGALGAVALAAAFYVTLGGTRAVVSMDIIHLAVVGLAGMFVLGVAANSAGGIWTALDAAASAGKLRGLNWSTDLAAVDGFLVGIVGGAAWSVASFGVDHIMVQRLLATGSIVRARRAVIGSGVVIVVATSLMLTFGTLLWATDPTASIDLPGAILGLIDVPAAAGLRGWVTAAVFVSATGALAASAISLGSSTAHDVISPSIDGRGATVSLPASRMATATWLFVIVGVVAVFQPGERQAALGLQLTTAVYGVLLGVVVVASLRRADPMRGSPGSFLLQRFDAWVALSVGGAAMTWLTWWPPDGFSVLAWPWRVPLGALITVLVGLLVRTIRKAVYDPTM